jgi:hypothetical protein
VSASASDAMSGMHGGYGGGLGSMGANTGGGSGGGMAAGSSMASLYPGGSVRSASGRLLPVGDGGAGVQVSVILLRGTLLKSTWCQFAGFALLALLCCLA